jgi:predicted O-methyltransferase YrrM
MSEPKGQILPDSEFGDLLTSLATQSQTILEIGTWHGKGSTLCLARGLKRPDQHMWTVDRDKAVWEEARGYYKHEPRITFLNARTVDVLTQLPIEFDLVLFDGADEDTNEEFDLLLPRLNRFVALDDTNVQKNERQVKLLTAWNWKLIKHRTGDRNGWAVFERP